MRRRALASTAKPTTTSKTYCLAWALDYRVDKHATLAVAFRAFPFLSRSSLVGCRPLTVRACNGCQHRPQVPAAERADSTLPLPDSVRTKVCNRIQSQGPRRQDS